jgi:hypothetical protein
MENGKWKMVFSAAWTGNRLASAATLTYGQVRFNGFTSVTTVVGLVGELLLIVNSPSVGSFATLQKRTGTSSENPIGTVKGIRKGMVASKRFPGIVSLADVKVRSPPLEFVIRKFR